MSILKLSEAKAHLGKYARAASKGARFVITEHNRPVAELSAVRDPMAGVRPKTGLMDGALQVPDDFDTPLEEFEKDFYGA